MDALVTRLCATELFYSLYERWQDEKQYEDIKDYLIPALRTIIAECGLTNPTMTKRPFGFTAVLGTATVHVFCQRSSVGWKRIK